MGKINKNKGKIVSFGEIMLRLAPPSYKRILQANQFNINYGGGEANVAISLAQFGHDVSYITRVPDNFIGQAAINLLRGYGVNTNYILTGGKRLGIYFLEHGASIRPSKVIYDRASSAISEIQPGMFNWHEIFVNKNWFHITGITPALSESCAEVSIEALKIAKESGLTTSCDLNYRKKLWLKTEARRVMSKMVENVDVVIANEEDAADIFGINAGKTNVEKGEITAGNYEEVAKELLDTCGAKFVAITLRESISASDNGWSALLYDGQSYYHSRKYNLHLVDRVGGGDSFGAGLIHGFISKWDKQKALDFAVAASGLKQTIPGDVNIITEAEVLQVSDGHVSGRVQR